MYMHMQTQWYHNWQDYATASKEDGRSCDSREHHNHDVAALATARNTGVEILQTSN